MAVVTIPYVTQLAGWIGRALGRSEELFAAFTTEAAVRSQLTLVWGAETFIVPTVGHTDEMVSQVERALLDLGRAKIGDLVVIVAGTPPGRRGTTNMLKIHRLGDPS